MKQLGFLKAVAYSLPAIMVTINTGCTDNENDPIPWSGSMAGITEITVTTSGGVFKALGGNVTLNFPANAVSQSKALSVRILMSKPLEETTTKEASGLVLKAILIEPFMVFDKPVQITLNCEGDLSNGVSLQEGMDLLGLLWENEVSFQKGTVPCACIACLLSPDLGTISMCICQSGVVAVQNEQ